MSGFVVQFYTSWYTQTADFLDSRFELNYFSIIRPLNFESINLIWNRIVFLSLIQPWKVLKYLFFKVCFFLRNILICVTTIENYRQNDSSNIPNNQK